MKRVNIGATTGEIVQSINGLIDERNEYHDALEASILAEMECTCDREVGDSCSSCPDDPCDYCDQGPCNGQCIQDRFEWAIADALDELRDLLKNGTAFDKLTAAQMLLDYNIAEIEITRKYV